MESKSNWTWQEIRDKKIVFEDDAILAINKPAGIAVVGAVNEMDIVRLAGDKGEKLLPVHRIDKVTSGLVLFAKNITAHAELTRQFNKRTVNKQYLAIVEGADMPNTGEIDLPLSIGRKNAVRVAAKREDIFYNSKTNTWTVANENTFSGRRLYPSQTIFEKLFENPTGTLLLVKPITGRRHQIRVHLAWIGYTIIGDPLFTNYSDKQTRTYLHSWQLAFEKNRRQFTLEAKPDNDFWKPLNLRKEAIDELFCE